MVSYVAQSDGIQYYVGYATRRKCFIHSGHLAIMMLCQYKYKQYNLLLAKSRRCSATGMVTAGLETVAAAYCHKHDGD